MEELGNMAGTPGDGLNFRRRFAAGLYDGFARIEQLSVNPENALLPATAAHADAHAANARQPPHCAESKVMRDSVVISRPSGAGSRWKAAADFAMLAF
jgi:hypothetical protein